MKKITLLFILCISFVSLIQAQRKGDMEVGGNIGLNLSNVSDISNENGTDSKFAFNVGGSFEYYFSETWGIKTKIIFDQKGWANGFVETTTIDEFGAPVFNTITTDYTLSYLTIPLMANFHFGGKKNWYFHAGPYAGFLLNANATESDIDIKDAFASTDFGLAFGIGYRISLNKETTLFFEYEAQSGFTDIFEENEGDTIRNGRSSLNVGILFNLN